MKSPNTTLISKADGDRFRAVALGLVILVLAAAVVIIRNLVQTNSEVQQMYAESIRGIKVSGDLMDKIQEARLYSLYTLASTDPNVQLESADASRERDPQVAAQLREHASLIAKTDSPTTSRELPELWDQYRKIRDEVLAAVLEGSRDEGLKLDRRAGLAAFNQLHDSLEQSEKVYSHQAAIRLEQIQTVSRHNILTVAFMLTLMMMGAGAALRALGHNARLLLRSWERFELAVAGSSDGIWDWDVVSGRVYFSPRWKSMIGFDDAELENDFSNWKQRVHPEDRDQTSRALSDYLEGRSPIFESEFRMLHKDGSYVWILSRGAALRDREGKPYRMAGSNTDITARRHAFAEQARLTAILEVTPDFVGSAATDGRVLYVNRAGRRMSGRGEHEDISRCTISNFHPAWVNRLLAEVALPTATRDGLWLGETAVLDGDGHEVPISQAIIAHKAADGTVEYFSTIARDISAQKKARKELEDLHKQLLETSRMAGMAEVATGVLHNVGNVLNSVNVSATLVMDQVRKSKTASLAKAVQLLNAHKEDVGEFLTNDPKGRQLPAFFEALSEQLSREQAVFAKETQALQRNIEHVNLIVAMQQSFAKVSGALESVPLHELVEDALRMSSGALARHHIEVVRHFEAVPPVLVDRHKVLQILVNLVSNARQALDHRNKERRLILRVKSVDNRVRVEVTDNGAGIAPENLTRIFQHGFTTKKTGHGFGLHSGANAAKEMGGSLTVQSDGPGTGATFILELPVSMNSGQQSAPSADESQRHVKRAA